MTEPECHTEMRDRPCKAVMLVNDDPSFIDVVGDALRAEGLAVLLVSGVTQAVAALVTGFRPDAVLLDVARQSEAWELLHVLRGTATLGHVPVCAASRDDQQVVEVLDDGHVRPLASPADAPELALILDEMCARHRGGAGAEHELRDPGGDELPLLGDA